MASSNYWTSMRAPGAFTVLVHPPGVDFPYLLFADQMGKPVERGQGKNGVGWLRAVTDVPTAADLLTGDTDVGAYLQSLKRTQMESIFTMGMRCHLSGAGPAA